MYYVVKINEYSVFKSDIRLIETADTLEKAKALRDAMRAIHPDEKYEVLVAAEQLDVLSMTLNCLLFYYGMQTRHHWTELAILP